MNFGVCQYCCSFLYVCAFFFDCKCDILTNKITIPKVSCVLSISMWYLLNKNKLCSKTCRRELEKEQEILIEWGVTPHSEIIVGDEPPCIFFTLSKGGSLFILKLKLE